MSRPWPEEVLKGQPLLDRYSRTAHAIGMLIFESLATQLGIDPVEIRQRHRIEEKSGDHIRVPRGPARKTAELPEIQTPAHTDFGTITILMNWLGGLQMWSDATSDEDAAGQWVWVKPKKNCAVVNLGDAAVCFTNGVLHSGRHRVLPAPGEQGKFVRYSVAYFVRPENECKMQRLEGRLVPPAKADPSKPLLNAIEWQRQQAQALAIRLDKD